MAGAAQLYPLSLHDALPISETSRSTRAPHRQRRCSAKPKAQCWSGSVRHFSRSCEMPDRSEEHTSELQSLTNLVCRLLLEKKKIKLYISNRSCKRTSV